MKKLIIMCLMAIVSVSMYAEKQAVTLFVKDMECNTCKGKVEKVLAYERGVKKLNFNVAAHTVTVIFDDKKCSVEKLQSALLKYLKYTSEVYNPKMHGGGKAACCSSTSCSTEPSL